MELVCTHYESVCGLISFGFGIGVLSILTILFFEACLILI